MATANPRFLAYFIAAVQGVVPQFGAGLMATLLAPQLSKREREVLQLIAEGFSNQQLAARLYLSPHTFKVHTRNIYGKLGVTSRTQAVARGRALGILHLP